MNNYQLYRTNIKLGGQVAWNLVLEDYNGKLVVNYFDVSPISPFTGYTYGQNTECVKYTHPENLRTLYKEIKGKFYDTCFDPQLSTIYPILDQNELNTHDTVPEMGCSRISYSRYKKQLQILCPVWLENFGVDDTLSFDITLYDKKTKTKLSSKRLNISSIDIDSYHNNFVTYFKNYVNLISTDDKIGDDVINVNITDKFASISGLDIKTGELISKDISDLIPNLIERERPLMEVDYMLIDYFHTSEMITKQLFNFNLVLNISDIVSNITDSMLKDNEFLIGINTYVNGIEIEKRTFNNNYSSVDLGDNKTSFNKVFKYLMDDKCIDTIRDNKIAPEICHWTLKDNNNYIFNLYPGFATSEYMFYGDSPDYWETDADKYPNVLSWINYNFVADTNVVCTDAVTSQNFTMFDINSLFVKYSRVDITDIENAGLTEKEQLSSYIIDSDDIDTIKQKLTNHNIYKYIVMVPENGLNGDIKFYVSDILYNDSVTDHYERIPSNLAEYAVLSFTPIANRYILIANKSNKGLLSFKWMSRALTLLDINKMRNINTELNVIRTLINKIVYPKFIYLYNTLGIVKADSPWTNTDEIYYVKNNNKSVTVVRYDGKIKPMFSTFDDIILYRIRQMSSEEFVNDPSFMKNQTQGFLPNYPSTGYFNIEIFNNSEHYSKNEYKWFNDSVVFNLLSTIETKIYSKLLDQDINYYNNDKLIDKIITDTYPNLTSTYKDYIRSLYTVDISYEYDEPAWDYDKKRFEYIYTIKLKLK